MSAEAQTVASRAWSFCRDMLLIPAASCALGYAVAYGQYGLAAPPQAQEQIIGRDFSTPGVGCYRVGASIYWPAPTAHGLPRCYSASVHPVYDYLGPAGSCIDIEDHKDVYAVIGDAWNGDDHRWRCFATATSHSLAMFRNSDIAFAGDVSQQRHRMASSGPSVCRNRATRWHRNLSRSLAIATELRRVSPICGGF